MLLLMEIWAESILQKIARHLDHRNFASRPLNIQKMVRIKVKKSKIEKLKNNIKCKMCVSVVKNNFP